MIADSVGFVADRGREAVYDAEHFFDGYKADRDYALVDPAGGPPGRRADARPVRHERRHADRRADRRSSATSGRRSKATPTRPRSPGASTPTTTPSWPWPTRWPRSRPASATSRPRSTATASAPATPTSCRSWPTSRSRPPHGLVPAGGGQLEGLTELSRAVAEIANVTPNDYQPYVGRSAFAHKGGVHGAAVAKVER